MRQILGGSGRLNSQMSGLLDLSGQILVGLSLFLLLPVQNIRADQRTDKSYGSSGAIPPLAELQAQLWILNLVGGLQMSCTGEVSYRLKVDADRRIQYAVDHDSYA